jgi:PEP-CTERM/exosortase A-associated glycosyltransferase
VIAVRILHVLDVSVPVVAGYTSRSRYIVEAQRALGLDPVVLTSVRQPNPEGRAMEEIGGIRYHRTLRPASSKRQPALEMHHLRRRVLEVARQEQVDVIHGHSSILCGLPSHVAARQLGLPSVYEIRAFWEDAAVTSGTAREGSLQYRAIRLAETALARRVDALVGICGGIRDEMAGRGVPEDRIHVVPNGVDTDAFAAVPPDEAVRARHGLAGKTVVAYIGTLFPFEGVADLIRALSRLIKDEGRDDVRGVIVGEGPSHEECQAVTAASGLAGKVLHLGRVPHAEVRALYGVADVLVYPRRSGRLTDLVTPLKPLEAMAMEKAVIGSDVGGLRELIQDEVTGLVHRPEDVGDLAAKIRRLVDDEGLRRRLGGRGRGWVVENRQWRTLVARNLGLYDRVRAARAKAPARAVQVPSGGAS